MATNANKKHKENLTRLEKIAVWVVNHVGSVTFFLICNFMVALTLIKPTTTPIIQFISSAWLQLILLPLIMIGQNVQTKHDEARADATYDLTVKIEKLLEIKINDL